MGFGQFQRFCPVTLEKAPTFFQNRTWLAQSDLYPLFTRCAMAPRGAPQATPLPRGLESTQPRLTPDTLAGAPCVTSGAENQQKRHHTACLPQGDPAFLLHTSQLHPTGSISVTLIPPNPSCHYSLAHGTGQPENCPQRWMAGFG